MLIQLIELSDACVVELLKEIFPFDISSACCEVIHLGNKRYALIMYL